MIRHLLMWRDRYRYRHQNNKIVACGEPKPAAFTMHVPKATCGLCLVSLDQLIESNLAKVLKWNNGMVAEVDHRAFPSSPPHLGTLFGIDASTYELWNGLRITTHPAVPDGTAFVMDDRVWTTGPVLGAIYSSPVTISAINHATKTITVSTQEVADGVIASTNTPPPKNWSRKPGFIPVRRLDGRR